jgi:Polyketide cyclase / dehydrase and lipid transport
MASARIAKRFDVSAEQLWALIGDFGDTGKWSNRPPEACLREGHGIGALRTLTIADGRVIVDRLVDEGPLHYSYEIVTSPLPVASYRATMAVRPLGAQACEFTWSGEFEPAGISDAQAIALFDGVYRDGLVMIERQLAIALEGSVG